MGFAGTLYPSYAFIPWFTTELQVTNAMTEPSLRQQLHQQIDRLPENLLREIADFAGFLVAKQQEKLPIADWNEGEWTDFSLGQLFREDDEAEYSLDDAQEVYKP